MSVNRQLQTSTNNQWNWRITNPQAEDINHSKNFDSMNVWNSKSQKLFFSRMFDNCDDYQKQYETSKLLSFSKGLVKIWDTWDWIPRFYPSMANITMYDNAKVLFFKMRQWIMLLDGIRQNIKRRRDMTVRQAIDRLYGCQDAFQNIATPGHEEKIYPFPHGDFNEARPSYTDNSIHRRADNDGSQENFEAWRKVMFQNEGNFTHPEYWQTTELPFHSYMHWMFDKIGDVRLDRSFHRYFEKVNRKLERYFDDNLEGKFGNEDLTQFVNSSCLEICAHFWYYAFPTLLAEGEAQIEEDILDNKIWKWAKTQEKINRTCLNLYMKTSHDAVSQLHDYVKTISHSYGLVYRSFSPSVWTTMNNYIERYPFGEQNLLKNVYAFDDDKCFEQLNIEIKNAIHSWIKRSGNRFEDTRELKEVIAQYYGLEEATKLEILGNWKHFATIESDSERHTGFKDDEELFAKEEQKVLDRLKMTRGSFRFKLWSALKNKIKTVYQHFQDARNLFYLIFDQPLAADPAAAAAAAPVAAIAAPMAATLPDRIQQLTTSITRLREELRIAQDDDTKEELKRQIENTLYKKDQLYAKQAQNFDTKNLERKYYFSTFTTEPLEKYNNFLVQQKQTEKNLNELFTSNSQIVVALAASKSDGERYLKTVAVALYRPDNPLTYWGERNSKHLVCNRVYIRGVPSELPNEKPIVDWEATKKLWDLRHCRLELLGLNFSENKNNLTEQIGNLGRIDNEVKNDFVVNTADLQNKIYSIFLSYLTSLILDEKYNQMPRYTSIRACVSPLRSDPVFESIIVGHNRTFHQTNSIVHTALKNLGFQSLHFITESQTQTQPQLQKAMFLTNVEPIRRSGEIKYDDVKIKERNFSAKGHTLTKFFELHRIAYPVLANRPVPNQNDVSQIRTDNPFFEKKDRDSVTDNDYLITFDIPEIIPDLYNAHGNPNEETLFQENNCKFSILKFLTTITSSTKNAPSRIIEYKNYYNKFAEAIPVQAQQSHRRYQCNLERKRGEIWISYNNYLLPQRMQIRIRNNTWYDLSKVWYKTDENKARVEITTNNVPMNIAMINLNGGNFSLRTLRNNETDIATTELHDIFNRWMPRHRHILKDNQIPDDEENQVRIPTTIQSNNVPNDASWVHDAVQIRLAGNPRFFFNQMNFGAIKPFLDSIDQKRTARIDQLYARLREEHENVRFQPNENWRFHEGVGFQSTFRKEQALDGICTTNKCL